MSTSELACTYAALILHDDGVEATADNIKAIIAAAGVEVEGYWPSLFAKLLEKKSMDDFITNVGAAPAGALRFSRLNNSLFWLILAGRYAGAHV